MVKNGSKGYIPSISDDFLADFLADFSEHMWTCTEKKINRKANICNVTYSGIALFNKFGTAVHFYQPYKTF